MRLQSKLAVEVIIKVGVQPLFRVGGGGKWCSDKMKLTEVEVVVAVGLEKVLKINFHGWVVGGWVAGSSGNKAISAFN